MKLANQQLLSGFAPSLVPVREPIHPLVQRCHLEAQPDCRRLARLAVLCSLLLGSAQGFGAAVPNVRFAIFGDCGEGTKTHGDCNSFTTDADQVSARDLMVGWNPDFVVTTGDNIYFTQSDVPTLTDTEAFDVAIGQYYSKFIKFPNGSASCFVGGQSSVNRFFPTIGNHDWSYDTSVSAYLAYFDLPGANILSGCSPQTHERYYDFIQGNVHFFILDSEPQEPNGRAYDSVQGQWLQSSLSCATETWKIVVLHKPPYTSSASYTAEPVLQWPFQAWGADMVVDGHVHAYERIMKSGFPYLTSGLGGRDIHNFGTVEPGSVVRYNADFGALLVSATDATATFQFFNSARNVAVSALQDTFILQKKGTAGIVERRVAAGTDDAEQYDSAHGNTVNTTSSDLELVFDTSSTGDQIIGIRFTQVAVPPKAAIRRAYIQFRVKLNEDGGTGAMTYRIDGQNSANPLTFAATANNISSRALTSHSVIWGSVTTPVPDWARRDEASTPERTEDISPIVQELVNLSGWANNNAMVFILRKNSGSAFRRALSYDGSSAGAPLLHIEWEQPNISVVATDPYASELGPDTATFTINRPGDNSTEALAVNFSMSGTATAGTSADYTVGGTGVTFNYGTLAGTVTIPQGSSSAIVTVTPLADAISESDETAVLTITTGAGYNVGSPSSATATILAPSYSLLIASSVDPNFTPIAALAVDQTGLTTGYGIYGGVEFPLSWDAREIGTDSGWLNNCGAQYCGGRGNGISDGLYVGYVSDGTERSALESNNGWDPISGPYSEVMGYNSDALRFVGYTGGSYAEHAGTARRGSLGPENGWAGAWNEVLSGFAGSTWSVANGVNASGDAVGASKDPANSNRKAPIFWPLSGSSAVLGLLPGAVEGEALSINNNGWIVGYCVISSIKRACIWKKVGLAYQVTDLGTLGQGLDSVATGINNYDQIIGYSGYRACEWLAGIPVDLNSRTTGNQGYTMVRAYGINDAGQIAGCTSWGAETSPPPVYPANYTARAFVLLRQ